MKKLIIICLIALGVYLYFSEKSKVSEKKVLGCSYKIFSHDNISRVAIVSEKNILDENYKIFAHNDISSIAINSTSKFMLVGSYDGTPKLLYIKDPEKIISKLEGHTDQVISVQISPDDKYAVTGSFDKTAKVWNIENLNNPILISTLKHKNSVSSVAFSPDSKYILVGLYGDYIFIGPRRHHGYYNGIAKLWSIEDPKNPKELSTLNDHKDDVRYVSISHDGKFAITGANDRTVKLWDIKNPQNPKIISTLQNIWDVHSVYLSYDDKYILIGSEEHAINHTARLWNIENQKNPKLVAVLEGHKDMVFSVALSKDLKYAIAGSKDSTVKLWNITNLKSPQEVATLKANTWPVKSVLFIPDSKVAVATSAYEMVFWDLSNIIY